MRPAASRRRWEPPATSLLSGVPSSQSPTSTRGVAAWARGIAKSGLSAKALASASGLQTAS